jgi:hypothetical protein
VLVRVSACVRAYVRSAFELVSADSGTLKSTESLGKAIHKLLMASLSLTFLCLACIKRVACSCFHVPNSCFALFMRVSVCALILSHVCACAYRASPGKRRASGAQT